MSLLIEKIHKIKASIPPHVRIVAATKYATLNDIHDISTHAPWLILGENRQQQGQLKQTAFPNISNPWHFIGHIQRNKISKIMQQYSLIHSVDRKEIIADIQKKSKLTNKKTSILLQVNMSNNYEKYGLTDDECLAICDTCSATPDIHIKGLMCMAPFEQSLHETKKTFRKTRLLYDKIESNGLNLTHLSMGMSNDYRIAIDEGSNMIRIGSVIFLCQ